MVEIAMKNAAVHAYIFKFGGTKKERVLKRRLSKSSWAFFWSVIYGRRLVFSFMFRENCTFFPFKKKKLLFNFPPLFAPITLAHLFHILTITSPFAIRQVLISFWSTDDLDYLIATLLRRWLNRPSFSPFFPRNSRSDRQENKFKHASLYFRAGRN